MGGLCLRVPYRGRHNAFRIRIARHTVELGSRWGTRATDSRRLVIDGVISSPLRRSKYTMCRANIYCREMEIREAIPPKI